MTSAWTVPALILIDVVSVVQANDIEEGSDSQVVNPPINATPTSTSVLVTPSKTNEGRTSGARRRLRRSSTFSMIGGMWFDDLEEEETNVAWEETIKGIPGA